jgi:FMN phosphatase YigB (HAD superfamily)
MTLALWPTVGLLRQFPRTRKAVRARVFRTGHDYRQAFAQDLGWRAAVPPDEADHWYHEVFLRTLVDVLRRSAEPRPQVMELLHRLHGAGIRLAVLSDIGRVEDRLDALGLRPEIFDLCLCTETTGALKPSPRALLTIARHWNSPPHRLLAVGDRLDLDAPAAGAAGMEFIGLRSGTLPPWKARRGEPEQRVAGLNTWASATRMITEKTEAWSQ